MAIASLRRYKKAHPEVEKAILSFDNAGCYHCLETVLQFFRNYQTIDGLTIIGLHFGEPGKGKCLCDQYFAILKALARRFGLAGNNIDSPDQFARAMCSDGGVANTIIQIGDIEGRIEDSKKNKKKYITNVSKYHEFLFTSDGILARYLPGFGKGEFFKIDRNELETYPNPKFVHEIVNKDSLRFNNLPYMEECQTAHEVMGTHTGAEGDGKGASEDHDIDDEDMASVRLKTCGKLNPLCTKTYLSMNGYIKHRDDPNDKCIVEVQKQSSMDQLVEMYVNTNGINGRYQGKTHKETRSLVHHTKTLPAVHPMFIDRNNKEKLAIGHALPQKKPRKHFSEKQRKFLVEKFNAGVGPNKHHRKKPKQVVSDMQEAGFEVDEWLNEVQIKQYFTKLAASQTDVTIPIKEDVKEDELIQDPAEIATAMQTEQAIQDELFINDIQSQMDRDTLQSDEDEDGDESPHPMYAKDLNLCELAADRLEASSIKSCTLYGKTNEELNQVISAIGVRLRKRSKKEVKIDEIVKYVQDNCVCLLFQ